MLPTSRNPQAAYAISRRVIGRLGDGSVRNRDNAPEPIARKPMFSTGPPGQVLSALHCSIGDVPVGKALVIPMDVGPGCSTTPGAGVVEDPWQQCRDPPGPKPGGPYGHSVKGAILPMQALLFEVPKVGLERSEITTSLQASATPMLRSIGPVLGHTLWHLRSYFLGGNDLLFLEAKLNFRGGRKHAINLQLPTFICIDVAICRVSSSSP